jgi:hypothetical protein
MPFFFLIWTKRDICCQVSAQENPIDSSGVVFFFRSAADAGQRLGPESRINVNSLFTNKFSVQITNSQNVATTITKQENKQNTDDRKSASQICVSPQKQKQPI